MVLKSENILNQERKNQIMEKTYVIEKWKHMPNMEKAFKEIQWVLSAIGKDESRINLTRLCVQDGFFICTNGYSLHAAQIDNEMLPNAMLPEDGKYEVVSNTQKAIVLKKDDQCADFPAVWEVFPPHHNPDKIQVSTYGKFALTELATKIYRLIDKDLTINIAYLEPFAKLEDEWEIYNYDHGSPVCFLNTNKIAAVMPMRLKE